MADNCQTIALFHSWRNDSISVRIWRKACKLCY